MTLCTTWNESYLLRLFDTVNHQLFLEILEKRFDVHERTKEWVSSYLSGRKFKVSINKSYSDAFDVNFSVPQGSINGSVFFTCYSSSLNTCVTEDQTIIGYADDQSICTSFKPGVTASESTAIQGLTSTMATVKHGMQANRLKMNDEISEFIVFGGSNQLPKCNTNVLSIGDTCV